MYDALHTYIVKMSTPSTSTYSGTYTTISGRLRPEIRWIDWLRQPSSLERRHLWERPKKISCAELYTWRPQIEHTLVFPSTCSSEDSKNLSLPGFSLSIQASSIIPYPQPTISFICSWTAYLLLPFEGIARVNNDAPRIARRVHGHFWHRSFSRPSHLDLVVRASREAREPVQKRGTKWISMWIERSDLDRLVACVTQSKPEIVPSKQSSNVLARISSLNICAELNQRYP
jgi:hypothetical protein